LDVGPKSDSFSFSSRVGFDESRAEPRPPKPNPPVLWGAFVAGAAVAGLSFLVSASALGSELCIAKGFEGVVGREPNAL
jgi:hypothetical protein